MIRGMLYAVTRMVTHSNATCKLLPRVANFYPANTHSSSVSGQKERSEKIEKEREKKNRTQSLI